MPPNAKPTRQKKTVPAPTLPQSTDGLAAQEASALANETLEKEAARSDHKRALSARHAKHCAALALLWLAVLIYSVFACVWAWHMALPKAYRFLEPGELASLQSFVLSGAVAAFLGRYFGVNGDDPSPRK